jgi:threonine/homoserine/homoserine lactone efflux protein
MQGLLEGLAAGYGIAVPVGAVSILIFTIGMKSGFRRGFAAGAGAATADLVYAAVACVAGSALVVVLQPVARVFRLGGGIVLLVMAAWGLAQVFRRRPRGGDDEPREQAQGGGAAYVQLLGITLVNPLTVVYFAALVLGRGNGSDFLAVDRLAFVLGVAAASLTWQSLLAVLGSLLHGRLSPRFRTGAVIAGNLVVAALGVRILVLALR